MGVSHIYNRSVNAKVISSLTHMKLISDSYVYTIISDKFCVKGFPSERTLGLFDSA